MYFEKRNLQVIYLPRVVLLHGKAELKTTSFWGNSDCVSALLDCVGSFKMLWVATQLCPGAACLWFHQGRIIPHMALAGLIKSQGKCQHWAIPPNKLHCALPQTNWVSTLRLFALIVNWELLLVIQYAFLFFGHLERIDVQKCVFNWFYAIRRGFFMGAIEEKMMNFLLAPAK